jgi:uncharacterized protein (TIGR03437 family)
MNVIRRLILWIFAIAGVVLHAQTLQLVSGNGQVIQEQFLALKPFTVRAVNAAGQPVAGVPITWSVTPFTAGTLSSPIPQTNAQGEASVGFFASNNPPGTSFVPATITATSPNGTINFSLVVSLTRGAGGNLVPLPFIQPRAPAQGATIEGPAGTILPRAVSVQVVAQGGISVGQPIPNVGLRVEPLLPSEGPSAACNGPGGIVLTGQDGIATCDLVLSDTPGFVQLKTVVGEYSENFKFDLTITPGQACAFLVSPLNQTFAAAGGSGSVSISAGPTCSWTASTTASWITITGAASGQGNGGVSYSIASNPGGQRSGTLTVAGQTVTLTQAPAGSTGGAIVFSGSSILPGATTGLAYQAGFNVSGGTPPYRWTTTSAVPPGLTLDLNSGLLSGTPTTAGTYIFPVTVTDTLNVSATQNFTLAVSQSGTGSPTFAITNSSFPAGSIGVPYQQPVTTSGSCPGNPFGGAPTITLASGTLPPGLTLQPTATLYAITGTPTTAGTSSFSLRASACGESTTRAFTITISGTTTTPPSTITATPAELAFTASSGGVTRPPDQNVSISSGSASTGFSIAVSTTAGGNWLVAAPTSGTTPAAISVGVANFGALAPGTYRGTVNVVPQTAGSSTLSIPVTLTITAPLTISVAPNALRFDHAVGSLSLSEQNVSVTTPFGSAAGVSFVTAIGANVAWLSVPPSGVTPASLRFVANSAGLAPGTYETSVTIAPQANPTGGQVVRVTLAVSTAPALSPSPGSLTFTGSGTSTPPPQSLTISTTGLPVSFTVTTATATGGNWLFIAPASGVTPATLNVTVNAANIPAGVHLGTITLRSDTTSAPVVVQVQLNVTPANPIITSVTNAASFAAGGVSPGEFVTIFGTALGPDILAVFQLNAEGRVETTLSGTRVLFDDIPAPLIYTSAAQVSAIVPYALAGRASTRVIVEHLGVRSSPMEVPVVESAPGIFRLGTSMQGAVLNQDGTLNGVQGAAPASSIVSIYATGEGLLAPAMTEGTIAAADNLARPLLPVSVQINGQQAEVTYAGVAPGLLVGLLQINARVPQDIAAGSVPITITIGSNTSQAATIAVR